MERAFGGGRAFSSDQFEVSKRNGLSGASGHDQPAAIGDLFVRFWRGLLLGEPRSGAKPRFGKTWRNREAARVLDFSGPRAHQRDSGEPGCTVRCGLAIWGVVPRVSGANARQSTVVWRERNRKRSH